MLYNTNILGYIGSENNKNHKKNILVIWDEHQKKILSELRFSENILNLKLRRDKIIVICLNKIYVFNLETFQTLDMAKILIQLLESIIVWKKQFWLILLKIEEKYK